MDSIGCACAWIKTNGQYDEYFVTFTINNTSIPPPPAKSPPKVSTPQPTKVASLPPTSLNLISSPADNSIVSGVVLISGAVDSPDFQSWKLDLLFDGNENQVLTIAAGRSRIPSEDVLTQLDTTLLPNGTHLLRLRVANLAGTFTETTRKFGIQNQLPEKIAEPPCSTDWYRSLANIPQIILSALFDSYLSRIKSACSL